MTASRHGGRTLGAPVIRSAALGVPQGLKNTGTDNYGGPVVTANGLLFIGATTIACGGGKNDAPLGGTYIAFALPAR